MVRIDKRTVQALKVLAARNKRSLTAEVAHILETHIDVQEAWPD